MDADAPAAPCRKQTPRSLSQPPALFTVRSRSWSRAADLGADFSSPSATPPRRSAVAVPFVWEEAPGMPKAASPPTATAAYAGHVPEGGDGDGEHRQDSGGHADQAARRPVPLRLPPRLQQVPPASSPFAAADAVVPPSPKTVLRGSGGSRSSRRPPKWARSGGAAFRRTTSAGMALLSRTWSRTAAAASGGARNRGGGYHHHERYAAAAGPDAPWWSPAPSSYSSSSVSTFFGGECRGRWRPAADGREASSDEDDDDGSPRGTTRFTRNRSVPSTTTFNLWGDSLPQKIAPKTNVAATIATFDDELPIVAPPLFTKAPLKSGNHTVHYGVDDRSKSQKSLTSRKALKKKSVISSSGREKGTTAPMAETMKDFSEGFSSSGEMDSTKDSYHIARSLGVSVDGQLAHSFNFKEIGLLPGDNAATLKFTEFCNKAIASLEVERDLMGVDDSALAEATNYHLVSTLLLNQSLHHQNQLYRHNIENEVVANGDRTKELEQELENLRKKIEEEKIARKMAEQVSTKLKEELTEMRKRKEDETTSFVVAARELMGQYRECLRGVGGDVELPAECTPASFISWLRGEIFALERHMMLGWDFAAITAFKAICMGLLDAGCNHVENLTVHDVDRYWCAPLEANLVGKRVFNEFWLAGPNDMAIMKGTTAVVRLPRRNSRSAKW